MVDSSCASWLLATWKASIFQLLWRRTPPSGRALAHLAHRAIHKGPEMQLMPRGQTSSVLDESWRTSVLGFLTFGESILRHVLCGSSEGLQWDWAPFAYRCNRLINTRCTGFSPFPMLLSPGPHYASCNRHPKTTCTQFLVSASVFRRSQTRTPVFLLTLRGKSTFVKFV